MDSPNAQHSPSAGRNKDVIADVLASALPAAGHTLTIAEGSGQHVACFAKRYGALTWQPSDPDPTARASIAAHTAEMINVSPPIDLDVSEDDWDRSGLRQPDAILCINMIHISPWAAATGLMAGAGRLLPPEGLLFTYGPYKRHGQHTSDSNAAFDQSLRSRNAAWGVRDICDLSDVATTHGLLLTDTIQMPANNFSLLFRKENRT